MPSDLGRVNGGLCYVDWHDSGYKDGLDNAKTVTKRCLGIDQNFIMFLLRHMRSFVRSDRFIPYLMKDSMRNTHLVRGHRAKGKLS